MVFRNRNRGIGRGFARNVRSIGGRRMMRRRNRKFVMLHRRPRRNVPKRLPVLGYAAGGTSTTFRVVLTQFQIPKDSSTYTSIYNFKIKDAFDNPDSYIAMIPVLYTNFQLQRVVFRVISYTGSTLGGVHSCCVFDDSMGAPATTALDYKDMISRGGSTACKLWSDLASEWVPTEPEDLNFMNSDSQELNFGYAAALAQNATAPTYLGLLVADITMVARTINPAKPTSTLTEELRQAQIRLKATFEKNCAVPCVQGE